MTKTLALLLPVALALGGEVRLGKPLSAIQPVPVTTVASDPGRYVGKTVQVKGRVSEVCQKAGCWMQLVDPGTGNGLRVKVRDGEIVFPASAIGKTAVAEGKLTKLELTREQLVAARKHEAEEQGRTFDPATVKSGQVMYQLAGTGAVIVE